MKDPHTVTATFKQPPKGLIPEAWRLLLAATNGKLLVPSVAQQYWKKHVARWEGEEPVSDSVAQEQNLDELDAEFDDLDADLERDSV